MMMLSNGETYKRSTGRHILFLLALYLGVLSGSVLYQFLGTSQKLKLVIYSEYIRNKLRVSGVDRFGLMKYIFTDKLKEVAILMICGVTIYCDLVYLIYIFYLGLKCSITICVLTTTCRGMAVVQFLLKNVPQIFVYIFIIYYISCKMERDRTIHRKSVLIMLVLIIGYTLMAVFINPLLMGFLL